MRKQRWYDGLLIVLLFSGNCAWAQTSRITNGMWASTTSVADVAQELADCAKLYPGQGTPNAPFTDEVCSRILRYSESADYQARKMAGKP